MVKISDSNTALSSKPMFYYAIVPRFPREPSGIRRQREKNKLRKMWLIKKLAAVTWLQSGLAETVAPRFNMLPRARNDDSVWDWWPPPPTRVCTHRHGTAVLQVETSERMRKNMSIRVGWCKPGPDNGSMNLLRQCKATSLRLNFLTYKNTFNNTFSSGDSEG